MEKDRGRTDRRRFLIKSASFLAGSVLGLGRLSRAFAAEMPAVLPFRKPRIALIIDDIGYSSCRARQFLDLNVPITFSILPRLHNSYKLACEIRAAGQEIMLHQPMEP
ncbi:MAG: divergent polysaccharide deacetylase family protein, partial [Pseudomonadota bacterium]